MLTHVIGVQLHCGHLFQRDVARVSAITAVKTARKPARHDDLVNNALTLIVVKFTDSFALDPQPWKKEAIW